MQLATIYYVLRLVLEPISLTNLAILVRLIVQGRLWSYCNCMMLQILIPSRTLSGSAPLASAVLALTSPPFPVRVGMPHFAPPAFNDDNANGVDE